MTVSRHLHYFQRQEVEEEKFRTMMEVCNNVISGFPTGCQVVTSGLAGVQKHCDTRKNQMQEPVVNTARQYS